MQSSIYVTVRPHVTIQRQMTNMASVVRNFTLQSLEHVSEQDLETAAAGQDLFRCTFNSKLPWMPSAQPEPLDSDPSETLARCSGWLQAHQVPWLLLLPLRQTLLPIGSTTRRCTTPSTSSTTLHAAREHSGLRPPRTVQQDALKTLCDTLETLPCETAITVEDKDPHTLWVSDGFSMILRWLVLLARATSLAT